MRAGDRSYGCFWFVLLVYAVERGLCKVLVGGALPALPAWKRSGPNVSDLFRRLNSETRELVGDIGLYRLCCRDVGGAACAVVRPEPGDAPSE